MDKEVERLLRGVRKTIDNINENTKGHSTLNLAEARHKVFVVQVATTALLQHIDRLLDVDNGGDDGQGDNREDTRH